MEVNSEPAGFLSRGSNWWGERPSLPKSRAPHPDHRELSGISICWKPGRDPKAAANIPSDAKAFLWDGSSFQRLETGDARRQASSGYVRFVVAPIPSFASLPGPLPGTETTTTLGVDTSPVYFVIPHGAGEK